MLKVATPAEQVEHSHRPHPACRGDMSRTLKRRLLLTPVSPVALTCTAKLGTGDSMLVHRSREATIRSFGPSSRSAGFTGAWHGAQPRQDGDGCGRRVGTSTDQRSWLSRRVEPIAPTSNRSCEPGRPHPSSQRCRISLVFVGRLAPPCSRPRHGAPLRCTPIRGGMGQVWERATRGKSVRLRAHADERTLWAGSESILRRCSNVRAAGTMMGSGSP